jgi:hypothetical protein
MDIVLENYLNSICCDETLPLNRIEFTTGNAPTIEDLETILGFTLLNPIKTGDVITFDNVGYHIPDIAFIGNNNLMSFDLVNGVTAGTSSFENCTSLTTTSGIVTAGNRSFQNCTSLTNTGSVITAGNFCFVNCTSLTNTGSVITAGLGCFAYCTSLTTTSGIVTAGDDCFYECTSLINIDFTNCDNIGQETGYNNVFDGITGNTITITAKTIHQTSNGGNLEGDLQYLADNNTVTFIWV